MNNECDVLYGQHKGITQCSIRFWYIIVLRSYTHTHRGGVMTNKICYSLHINIYIYIYIYIYICTYRVSLKICYTYEFRQGSQSGLFLIRSGLLVPPCKRSGLYLGVSGCSTEGFGVPSGFPIELCDVYCALDGDLVSLTRKVANT